MNDGIAEVGPAIADQHDVPARIAGQDRPGQLKGGRDVRVVNIRLALEGAELRIGACVHLDLRIAAEAHDPDAVVARPRGEDALHRGELRVLRALNAGGAVGHDDQ